MTSVLDLRRRMTESVEPQTAQKPRNAEAIAAVKFNKNQRDAVALVHRLDETGDTETLVSLTRLLMQRCLQRGIQIPMQDILSTSPREEVTR